MRWTINKCCGYIYGDVKLVILTLTNLTLTVSLTVTQSLITIGQWRDGPEPKIDIVQLSQIILKITKNRTLSNNTVRSRKYSHFDK